MPLWLFEIACHPVLALAIVLSARRAGPRRFAIDDALLAFAGLVGEETGIRLALASELPRRSVLLSAAPASDAS